LDDESGTTYEMKGDEIEGGEEDAEEEEDDD